MSKKILFTTVGYTLGGAERMIERISPVLKNRGYDVRVMAFKGYGPISENLKEKSIECYALNGAGRFDFRVIWRYYLYLRRLQPDVVIAFLYRAYIPTRIICWLLEIPCISSVRDVQRWQNSFHKFIERVTAPLSSKIYACSYGVKEYLLTEVGLTEKEIIVIHNGISVGEYQISQNKIKKRRELGLKENIPVIGTVSRLHEPKKGIKILLEAAEELSKKNKCQFIIIGSGKDENILKKMADEKKLPVIFTGQRKDIPELLDIMHVFVLPSLYEGLPVALLEAMAAGLPVVATDVGGVSEVVEEGKTGFIVEPGNKRKLISKIERLLKYPQLRKNFGGEGFKRIKRNFSIDKTVDRIESLLDFIFKGNEN